MTAELSRVYEAFDSLLFFASERLELPPANHIWVRNQILGLFNLDSYAPSAVEAPSDTSGTELMDELASALIQAGLATAEQMPSLSDQILGIVSLDPARLQQRFASIAEAESSTAAMTWLYDYSVATNYVRKADLDRNPRFSSGDLIITINLAKPEFRTAASAQSGNSVSGGYPQCTICRDNEGFAGRVKFTLRTVPLTLDGEDWFWQFSPYGYFNEHGIAVNCEHRPMHVDERTFAKLMDFVDLYPEYFLGCNAALPRAGGSVLGHDHFQGGRGPLPMQVARAWQTFDSATCDDALIEVLDWHNTAIRIVSPNRAAIETIAQTINTGWRAYRNEALGIIPGIGNEHFHAISPTAIKTERGYELSIILRSNITSAEYPEGVFHAHPEFFAIKQESIGLIEAQGLFILPARLVSQLGEIKELLISGGALTDELAEFDLVFDELRQRLGSAPSPDAVDQAIVDELGSVCQRILANTAVFKDRQHTVEFLESLGLI